jgi:hypothetical protein
MKLIAQTVPLREAAEPSALGSTLSPSALKEGFKITEPVLRSATKLVVCGPICIARPAGQ